MTQKKKKKEIHMWCKMWGKFSDIEKCLITTPILTLPHGIDEFVIYIDASNLGHGKILMQQGKVIAYALWQLKVHEKTIQPMI